MSDGVFPPPEVNQMPWTGQSGLAGSDIQHGSQGCSSCTGLLSSKTPASHGSVHLRGAAAYKSYFILWTGFAGCAPPHTHTYSNQEIKEESKGHLPAATFPPMTVTE